MDTSGSLVVLIEARPKGLTVEKDRHSLERISALESLRVRARLIEEKGAAGNSEVLLQCKGKRVGVYFNAVGQIAPRRGLLPRDGDGGQIEKRQNKPHTRAG